MSDLSSSFQIHLLAQPDGALIDVAFESVAEQLQVIERLYFEMDGSFVWTGAEPSPWQIDGMIYDLGSSIQRVELKGYCPRDAWNQLLSVLNYPSQSLVAYDLQSAKFVPIEQLESQLWSC